MAKSLVITMALLLCCRSPADAQTGACSTIADTATIVRVGAFSNVRYTDEHAYGYTVMLWRVGNCLVGFFESSEGLAGDPPIGELQNVRYDSKTAALSFSAKLTTGLVSFRGSNGVEQSRDLYTFDGFLRATTVTGVVTHVIQNSPNLTPTRNEVTLRSSKEQTEFMDGATTYGQWRDKWRPILRARGPKW